MRGLLTGMSGRFDWVIIDSPPIDLLPEPAVLAGLVDAVVLLAAAGTTSERLQRAVDSLGRNRVLGVVLNRVRG